LTRAIRHAAFVVLLSLVAGSVSARALPGVVFQTSVAPSANDDASQACGYELTLLDPARTIRGVWVIFDRGRDTLRYYGDPDVAAFARAHDLALLLAFHCAGKDPGQTKGDIDVEPAKGLGPMLFRALEQLATMATHPELATAKVVLLGFSGTGVLVARFPDYAPDRVLAVITANAGHFDPVGLDTIRLSPRASSVPQLVIAGGSDAVSGTTRPYDYFRRHFEQGAPWAFLLQNGVPHCCAINAKPLVLAWLSAWLDASLSRVPAGARQRQPASEPSFTRRGGSYGFIQTTESELENCPPKGPTPKPPSCQSRLDTWGGTNSKVRSATIDRRASPPRDMRPAGWFPSRSVARAWLTLVTVPQHPITSLP